VTRRRRRVAVGERVYLRKSVQGDRSEFVERAKASRTLHRPWISAPEDDLAFDDYLRRYRRKNQEGFLICLIGNDAIAGVCHVNEIVRGWFQSGYLGYYAFEPFAAKGYMTEGLRLLVRHAFTRMGLHRLEANVQPENTASIALVKAVGLRREGFSPNYLKIGGQWRDHERWAITLEDWRARRDETRR
jgi:ribosomal-protein-alanine N-acetyltransferase